MSSTVLVIMPNGVAIGVQIPSDRVIKLEDFAKENVVPGYSLYLTSPSWTERLPAIGSYKIPKIYTKNPPKYRFQYLPNEYPDFIMTTKIKVQKLPELMPWSFTFSHGAALSFDVLIQLFMSIYCVSLENVKIVFDKANPLLNDSILRLRQYLCRKKFWISATVSPKSLANAKKYNLVISEIVKTEEEYIKTLEDIITIFNKAFFEERKFDLEIYKRAFKNMKEILEVHKKFYANLMKNGVFFETSIGKTFLDNMVNFRKIVNLIAKSKAALKDVQNLLAYNKDFSSTMNEICQKEFNVPSPEYLLISPSQRITRYSIFIKNLLKYIPNHHWDYGCLISALNELALLDLDIEESEREQEEYNRAINLQIKLGFTFKRLQNGRKRLILEYPKINTTSSLYMFDNGFLIHDFQKNLFTEIPFFPTDFKRDNNFLYIGPELKIQMNKTAFRFYDELTTAKKEYVLAQANYGLALIWEPLEADPGLLLSSATTILGGFMYVFGGFYKNGSISNDLWQYDDEDGTWRKLQFQKTPSPRYGASLCSYNDKLILFGGKNNTEFFNELYTLDPHHSSKWKRVKDNDKEDTEKVEIEKRAFHSALIHEDSLYIFGGKSEIGFLGDLLKFDFSLKQWILFNFGNDGPTPRSEASFFAIHSFLGVFGGLTKDGPINDLVIFDKESTNWILAETSGDVPEPQFGQCSAFLDESLYILGGENLKGERFPSYKLSLKSWMWTVLPQLNAPECFNKGSLNIKKDFGFWLFGGGDKSPDNSASFYKIKIMPHEKSLNFYCKGQNYINIKTAMLGFTLSSPIVNYQRHHVTTSVNNRSSNLDFQIFYDEKNVNEVLKKSESGPIWLKECLISEISTQFKKSLLT